MGWTRPAHHHSHPSSLLDAPGDSQPQVQICSPIAPCSPQVCQTAHLNLGRRWAAGVRGSPGLPGSQLASGQSKKGSALGH